MTAIATIRPGLLVSVKTSIVGGIAYDKREIEAEHTTESGARKARWETERTISDPAEHERAVKTRGRMRSLITSVCASSAFGLLCPIARRQELDSAIAEARKLADAFNDGAKLTRVKLYILAGQIADSDMEAVRAIKSEIAELLDTMDAGLRNADVKAIREAASKARNVGQMLPEAAQSRIREAIDAARAAARKIAKAGENAAIELDAQALAAVGTARMAFLDLDEAAREPDRARLSEASPAPAIDLEPDASQPGTAEPGIVAAIAASTPPAGSATSGIALDL